MIDCHAHLASPAFDADRASVLARMAEVGVTRVLVVGEDLADDERVLEVSARHPGVLLACVGLHPDRFADEREPASDDEIDGVCALARRERGRLAAIGEVGLDHFHVEDPSRRAKMRACLERMAELARELDLPLNVHSRSAGHYALDLLSAVGASRVLMHAFDGKAGHAMRAAERHGFVFSIPPSVVRSEQKQKLCRALPLESLALESDSPVLGPVRGERNEPANLRLSVAFIAGARGLSEERVREVTTRNAERLFGLGPAAPGL